FLGEQREQHQHCPCPCEQDQEGAGLEREILQAVQPPTTRAEISAMKVDRACPIIGKVMIITTPITKIFGTKVSVISWICVSACTRPISTPTISEAIIIGPATVRTRNMAACASTRV